MNRLFKSAKKADYNLNNAGNDFGPNCDERGTRWLWSLFPSGSVWNEWRGIGNKRLINAKIQPKFSWKRWKTSKWMSKGRNYSSKRCKIAFNSLKKGWHLVHQIEHGEALFVYKFHGCDIWQCSRIAICWWECSVSRKG